MIFLFFFFNDTATTEIYTLSLHDALPISGEARRSSWSARPVSANRGCCSSSAGASGTRQRGSRGTASDSDGRSRSSRSRSEEHTSELQSRSDLVCRLLLEKKKKKK